MLKKQFNQFAVILGNITPMLFACIVTSIILWGGV